MGWFEEFMYKEFMKQRGKHAPRKQSELNKAPMEGRDPVFKKT